MSTIDNWSGVVAKEVMDETEDVLLLWGFEDIDLRGSTQGLFIDGQIRAKPERKLWRDVRYDAACWPRVIK